MWQADRSAPPPPPRRRCGFETRIADAEDETLHARQPSTKVSSGVRNGAL